MEHLRPNGQRGKMAVAMLWIMLVLYLLMGLSNYFEYRMLARVAGGQTVSTAAALANDSRQQLIAVVTILAYVVSTVVFIMWFRRAYYNLHLRAKTLSYTEGWAAGVWFVPFINFFRPYQIMRELYEETYALMGNKPGSYPEHYTTAFLGWWWTLWIINGIIDRVDFRLSMAAKTLDEMMNSSIVSMISCGIGIPLALIAVKVVSDYIRMERLFAAQDMEEPASDATPKDHESQDHASEIVSPGPLL